MIKLGNIVKEQTAISVSQQKVNSNINELLQEHAQSKNNLNENWIDNIQYIADFAGFIPVYGDIIDAINAIVYFIRGKFFEGVLSIIAIIPGVGSVIALPFKVLFKTLGVALNPVMKLGAKMLATGQGKAFAKTFTDFCIKQGKTKELKSVTDIVKKYNNTILDFLKPVTSKFDALHNFNHILIPNAIEKSIQKLGKTGSTHTKGLIDFFTELGETPAKKIKPMPTELASPAAVMKHIYADKSIKKWLKTLTPTEFATIRSRVLNGKYKFDDVFDLSRKSINPDYAITQGIKFSADDLKIVELLALAAKRKGLMNYKFVTRSPFSKFQRVNVTIEVVNVKKVYPDDWKNGLTDAWAEPKFAGFSENKIILDVNYIKDMPVDEIESIIIHELAHIKDPSFVSPKLTARYSPGDKNLPAYTSFNLSKDPADAGKTFWNTYYHHPFEINAITPQVLGHMVKTTKRVVRNHGKRKTLSALNRIENWTKGIDGEDAWSQIAAEILGYSSKVDINVFFDTMAEKNPIGYKTLTTQIANQISNLKTQINKLSEGISTSRGNRIKLKNLL
jgi:hypothetical protein